MREMLLEERIYESAAGVMWLMAGTSGISWLTAIGPFSSIFALGFENNNGIRQIQGVHLLAGQWSSMGMRVRMRQAGSVTAMHMLKGRSCLHSW